MKCNTILFVKDQKRSRDFWAAALGVEPTLDVPGMTEFTLSKDHVLGLMPEVGIKKLLDLPDFSSGSGFPRAEIYLTVEDPEARHQVALSSGARELSKLEPRNWGDEAAYSLDPDGHILVFARKL